MTARQEAHQLINELPDNTVYVIVQIMKDIMPKTQQTGRIENYDGMTPKMKAFLRTKELREITAQYNLDFEKEREEAIQEKYGSFSKRGN